MPRLQSEIKNKNDNLIEIPERNFVSSIEKRQIIEKPKFDI
jgi:hypothetical protein